MSQFKEKCLVIRETQLGDNDCYITVLTAGGARQEVLCRGVRRKGSRTAGAVRLFCWSELDLYESRGKLTLNDAALLHSFWNVTQDIECYAACCYFAELAACMTDTDEAQPMVTRILLLALYALTEQGRPVPLVKAAFEMRLMAESGFAPDLTACAVCETSLSEMPVYFSVKAGQAACASCAARVGADFVPLHPAVMQALVHMLRSDPKKLYAFALSPAPQRQLTEVCEAYALHYAERGFDSLKFYHTLVDNA